MNGSTNNASITTKAAIGAISEPFALNAFDKSLMDPRGPRLASSNSLTSINRRDFV